MSNFNTCKSNTLLIIVIVATSLTEVITLRRAEVLVNELAIINCFSKEVKRIQWHHTPPGKSNKYVYAGGRFYPPYNTGRFHVHNDLTSDMYTIVIANIMHEDAGLYECKDDVLSGVFGSTYLTVLDSSPVCISNMNPYGFVGPNTCNIEQENMSFSCAVSFSGNTPNLTWSTLNGSQSLNSSICKSKDNKINCSLSMKADPSFDGSTFICQTTTSNDARYNCSIEDMRVEYFWADYVTAEKIVGDNVTCAVASNLQIHYNWTIQQNNKDNMFTSNRTIYFQAPGFYKCSVKYNIRDVTCHATVVTVNVSNIDVKETAIQSYSVSTEQTAIGVSIGVSMCLVAFIIAFVVWRTCFEERNAKELEYMKRKITETTNRLKKTSDFLSNEFIRDMTFLFSLSNDTAWPQRENVGDMLATSGVTELFFKVWNMHSEMEFSHDDNSVMKSPRYRILLVLSNFTHYSTELCRQVFESNLHLYVLDCLKLPYLNPSKTAELGCRKVVINLMGVLYNMLQKVPHSSLSLINKQALDVLASFRESQSQQITTTAIILIAYMNTKEQLELLNADNSDFEFLKSALDWAVMHHGNERMSCGFTPIEMISAINLLAENDNNKAKIVNAGLLSIYTKLLEAKCSEEENMAAVTGISILASKYRHEINKEPQCVTALRKLTEGKSKHLKDAAEKAFMALQY